MPSLTSIPTPGNLGPIEDSTVPKDGFIGPQQIGEDIWIVRRLFSLGAGQRQGLAYEGLRARLLALLGDSPLQHSALAHSTNNESTDDQIFEEREKVSELCAGEYAPFPLDTTMTIVRKDGRLTLHSVVPCDPELLSSIRQLGTVSLVLVPNLQHWLFLEEWLQHFPTSAVGLVQSACNEDLWEKMPFLNSHRGEVFKLQTGKESLLAEHGLTGQALDGAPLALNEFLFHHTESNTLLASDSFYGGYSNDETPTWFARLWFKLNKYGSFRAPRLPIYRTSRVLTHGNQAQLMKSVNHMLDAWDVDQITFSHGTSPFDEARLKRSGLNCASVGDAYKTCWRSGLAAASN